MHNEYNILISTIVELEINMPLLFCWHYEFKGPAPPPLEIEKKVIRANFKLFHLYFATFLAENIFFSAVF